VSNIAVLLTHVITFKGSNSAATQNLTILSAMQTALKEIEGTALTWSILKLQEWQVPFWNTRNNQIPTQ
jgi:hypothetical protein